jgi:hypothetical protein
MVVAAAGPVDALPRTADKPVETGESSELRTYGIGPANKKGLDRRPAFVYVARPGDVIRDAVGLVNYTTKPVRVRVYANDAFTADGGAFDVLPEAQKPDELGAWTSLRPKVVTIPARGAAEGSPPAQVRIPFTVKVPKDATPGDHAAGIVASTRTGGPSTATVGGSVVVDRRVGTRIYLRVPGDLEPRLEVKDLTASYDGTLNPLGAGSVRISYRVENTGNVALSASQTVRVDGLLGTSAASEPLEDVRQVLPGDDVTVSTVVTGVWPTVRGTAVVELSPYSGEGDTREVFPMVEARTGLWMVPWTLIALLVGAAFATYFSRRRRARRSQDVGPSGTDAQSVELVDA